MSYSSPVFNHHDNAVSTNRSEITYRLRLLVVAVAGVVFLLLLDRAYRLDVARDSELQLSDVASRMQRRLSVSLNNLTLVVADLRAYVLSQPDRPSSQNFAHFAATLLDHYPALDALVLVGPDRVIHDIYPLDGNEDAIGLDLSQRPVAPYIEKAILERRLIVDPPHLLSNGRLAVIARLPMFREEQFVGLAQAILNIPHVIQSEFGLLSSRFSIQVRDENGKLFWGATHLERVAERREVVVGNGVWTLSVAHANGPPISRWVIALIWGAGGLVVLFAMGSVRHDHLLQRALKTEVAKATNELRSRNEELEQQISQRLAAEGQLRRNEQRLHEAQQIAHLGNWEWDFAENRGHWSEEIYRIFDLNHQEFKPNFETFIAHVHPEDRELFERRLAHALAHGNLFEHEHRIVRPDGTVRYLRSTGVVERDAQDKLQRMTGTAQDITVQKLALNAVEESERKYRAVLENASDGIVITSLQGKVLDVNRRIQALLGYSREELLKLSVSQIHPATDADKLHAAFINMRERGFSLFEHLLLRKDGTTTPAEVAGTLIAFDGQQVALGVFRDIRERKRVEAELHQHRNHLEHLVEQRTADLVALNGELEAFSYSVSHDLRAPLRAIQGFSTALQEDYAPLLEGAGRDYLRRIQSAIERMGRLIDSTLQLSRTISAKMHWENVSLSTIVAELLQELHAADPQRQVRSVVAAGIFAQGDPTLLNSLLQNLLSNAWKFTQSRDVAVIEFGVTTREGKIVYFVRDNGIGFEMIHAHEIFTPFHRLHASSDYEGSGIGLATVQRIVHRHGGQIWAESEPQRGTTFYFTLCAE